MHSNFASSQFNVIGYNPIGRMITSFFKFPVNAKSFEVLDGKGQPVASQVGVLLYAGINTPIRDAPSRKSSVV